MTGVFFINFVSLCCSPLEADYSDDKPVLEKEFEGGFDDLETEKTVVPTSQPKVETGKVTATAPTNKKKKQLLKEAVERKEAQAQAQAQVLTIADSTEYQCEWNWRSPFFSRPS